MGNKRRIKFANKVVFNMMHNRVVFSMMHLRYQWDIQIEGLGGSQNLEKLQGLGKYIVRPKDADLGLIWLMD